MQKFPCNKETIMKNILKKIISDFHSNSGPHFKYRKKKIPLNIDKIITIIGPRRAGKTYSLFQIIETLLKKGVPKSHILYLNFEDERLEFNKNYDIIIDAWLELYPNLDIANSWIFFDEIQEIENWEKFIRRLYDTKTKHIFLAGSNSKLLSQEIATSLRGRSLSFEVMPLSFKEYLDFKNIDKTDRYSTKNSSIINNAFEKFLLLGGYPEIVNYESNIKIRVLQEYFNVMIYRDLVERYNITNISVLKYLIKRMISSFTKEFSPNKLFNELKTRGFSISKDTVYKMVSQILSVYVFSMPEKFDKSVVKRTMTNKKIYLFDNGYYSASNYSIVEDRGKLLENLVYINLLKKFQDIFFLKNNHECDFICFSRHKKPLIVQATYILHADNLKREIKGFEAARKKIGEKIGDAQCLLLFNEKDNNLPLPSWIKEKNIIDWLLE
jgi:uncharacterized protein